MYQNQPERIWNEIFFSEGLVEIEKEMQFLHCVGDGLGEEGFCWGIIHQRSWESSKGRQKNEHGTKISNQKGVES